MEKTWWPPESVTIARRQPMNSWRPPISRTWSGPGWMKRWKVLPSTMSKPSSATSAACRDLTEAVEASGTKAGVRTSPWCVWITPALAGPSRAAISKTGGTAKSLRTPGVATERRVRPPHADKVDARPRTGTGAARPTAPDVLLSWSGLRLRCAALHGRRAAVLAGRSRLDLHPARLALLGLRDRHLEDAAVEVSRDPVGVHPVRQGQRAAEAAERALDPVPAALARLVLGLALAGDGERAVLHLDRDVALVEAGQVGLQDEGVLGLDQVHLRDPAAGLAPAAEEGGGEAIYITGERLRVDDKSHV